MIIIHIPEKEKKLKVEKICRSLKQPIIQVTTADAGRTLISILSGKKENAPAWPMYQLPELIIFAGLPDRLLDRFLAEFKAAGISNIPLKAVVTQYNIGWTLKDLAAELQKEHQRMTK